MRLATFLDDAQQPRVGVVNGDQLIALPPSRSGADMLSLIRSDVNVKAEVASLTRSDSRFSLDPRRLLAPIPNPPEFLGVGLNYRDHASEAGLDVPESLTVFNKQVSCITAPEADVHLPSWSDQLDYEGELGVVVGRARRNMSAQEAKASIFGYVVVNDFSLRDVQFSSPTVTMGKSLDTHGPFGPWIVTADEIGNPQALSIETRVNGELRQSGSTAEMVFSCAEIIAHLSRVMTLLPGTVVTTGTPAGVAYGRKPPNYLRIGDIVSVEITGIGRLCNRVVAEPEISA